MSANIIYVYDDGYYVTTVEFAVAPTREQLAWVYADAPYLAADEVHGVEVRDADDTHVVTFGVTRGGPVWLPRGARVRGDGSVEWRGHTLLAHECEPIQRPESLPRCKVVGVTSL